MFKGGVFASVATQGARDQGELCNPSRSERSQSANTKKTASSVRLYMNAGAAGELHPHSSVGALLTEAERETG